MDVSSTSKTIEESLAIAHRVVQSSTFKYAKTIILITIKLIYKKKRYKRNLSALLEK